MDKCFLVLFLFIVFSVRGQDMERTEDFPSAEEIINNFIKALGGREKLEGVKSIEMISIANVHGMDLQIKNVAKEPGMALNSITMDGMPFQETIYNQGRAKMTIQGRELPLNEQMLEEMKYNTSVFPEVDYMRMDVEMEVVEKTSIKGQDAYAVKITYPTGTTKTEYFSRETGLKLRTQSVSGHIDYGEYKEIDGIKFPEIMIIATPQGPLESKLVEVKINQELPNETFDIE